MARIRTIKPEFWVDDQMVEQSFLTRLLFLGLLNFVDDEGLIEYKPKRIKMQVFPADSVSVHDELTSLIESGRLEVVSSDQGDLLHVVNFRRHQRINRPTATNFTGLPAGFSVSPPAPVSESSSRKGKEGKGKERAARATELPTSWKPTAEHTELARSRGVDITSEADAFRLHAEANARKAVRWNAAFTMWLKKARVAVTVPKVDPRDEWKYR